MVSKYLMVDLETLGTDPDAVVLSAGFVVFDLEGNTYQEYYEEFHLVDQISAGRTVSKDTQDWWIKTDRGEMYRLMEEGRASLWNLVDDLEEIYEATCCQGIFQRGNMDIAILRNVRKLKIPYWHEKDCRAFDILDKMPEDNNHNALDDCKNQIQHIAKIVEKYNA